MDLADFDIFTIVNSDIQKDGTYKLNLVKTENDTNDWHIAYTTKEELFAYYSRNQYGSTSITN